MRGQQRFSFRTREPANAKSDDLFEWLMNRFWNLRSMCKRKARYVNAGSHAFHHRNCRRLRKKWKYFVHDYTARFAGLVSVMRKTPRYRTGLYTCAFFESSRNLHQRLILKSSPTAITNLHKHFESIANYLR